MILAVKLNCWKTHYKLN